MAGRPARRQAALRPGGRRLCDPAEGGSATRRKEAALTHAITSLEDTLVALDLVVLAGRPWAPPA
jgi:hypothetical protein